MHAPPPTHTSIYRPVDCGKGCNKLLKVVFPYVSFQIKKVTIESLCYPHQCGLPRTAFCQRQILGGLALLCRGLIPIFALAQSTNKCFHCLRAAYSPRVKVWLLQSPHGKSSCLLNAGFSTERGAPPLIYKVVGPSLMGRASSEALLPLIALIQLDLLQPPVIYNKRNHSIVLF